MKVWDCEIWTVSSKKNSDYWEHWSTLTVRADTIEEAIQKALVEMKDYKFYKVEVRKAELIREIDVE